MLNPVFLIKLSESEKKALIIVAVIFAFLFVVIGLIIKVIKDWYKRKGEEIDNYMYDYVKYGIIKSPIQFRKYVIKRERRTLYLAIKIPMRIMTILLVVYIIYCISFSSFSESFNILKDLAYKFDWPTTKIFGMNIICDWPTITQYPKVSLTLTGYVTYITYATNLVCLFFLIKGTLIYNARIARSSFVSNKAFHKNLENGVDVIHE